MKPQNKFKGLPMNFPSPDSNNDPALDTITQLRGTDMNFLPNNFRVGNKRPILFVSNGASLLVNIRSLASSTMHVGLYLIISSGCSYSTL